MPNLNALPVMCLEIQALSSNMTCKLVNGQGEIGANKKLGEEFTGQLNFKVEKGPHPLLLFFKG